MISTRRWRVSISPWTSSGWRQASRSRRWRRSFPRSGRGRSRRRPCEAYRSRISVLAKLSPLEIWHSKIDLAWEIERIEDRALRRQLSAIVSKTGSDTRRGRQLSAPGEGQAGTHRRPAAAAFIISTAKTTRDRVDSKRVFSSYQDSSRAGAALSRRALRAQGRRLQGRRGRKRRHVLRRRPVHERRRRSAVPAGQGSGEIRARVPGAEIQGASGPASGRGSARHAGGERRLPGLDARTTGRDDISTCAS